MELSMFAAHTPAKELNTSRPACRSFYDPHNTLQLISKQKSSTSNSKCEGKKCRTLRVSSADVHLQSAKELIVKETSNGSKYTKEEESSKHQLARTQYIYCAQYNGNNINNANSRNNSNESPMTLSSALSETQKFITPITPERKENTLFDHSFTASEQTHASLDDHSALLNVTMNGSESSYDSNDDNNNSTDDIELQMNASYTPLNLELTSNAPFRRNALLLISPEPDVQEQEKVFVINNSDNAECDCKTKLDMVSTSDDMHRDASTETNDDTNNYKESVQITKEMYTPQRCTDEFRNSHNVEESRQEDMKQQQSSRVLKEERLNEEHAALEKETPKDQTEHEHCVMVAITPTQIRKQATESYRYKRCSALQCDLLENEQKRQWSKVADDNDDDDDDEWSECSESQQVLFHEYEEKEEVLENQSTLDHSVADKDVHDENTSKEPCLKNDMYNVDDAYTSNKNNKYYYYCCVAEMDNNTSISRSHSASHARPSSTMREYTSHDDNDNYNDNYNDNDTDEFNFTDNEHHSHYNENNHIDDDNRGRYYHYSKCHMSEEKTISISYLNADKGKDDYDSENVKEDWMSMTNDGHDVMSELVKRHVAFQQVCLSEYCTRVFSALLTPFTFTSDVNTSDSCSTGAIVKDDANDDAEEQTEKREEDNDNEKNISVGMNAIKTNKNTHVDISKLGVAPTPPSSPFNHSANAPRQMSIVSQLLIENNNNNTMLNECNEACTCNLTSAKGTESKVCDSARHVLCILFREYWNYECVLKEKTYNSNNDESSIDIISDHMSLINSSGEITQIVECNMYEKWCDAYFAFYLTQHDNMIEHLLFDTMYFYMVARPALSMLEFAERRIICMQRDLYMHDRIELFMLLAHELLPSLLQTSRKEHTHKKSKGQLVKTKNKHKDNPTKAMHVFSFFHSTAKSTYKPSSLMRTSAKLTKSNNKNSNNNNSTHKANNKSSPNHSFEYTLHLKKKNLKTPRAKRNKQQHQEKYKRDSYSFFTGFLPALNSHKRCKANSAKSANYKDEMQSISATSPVLHASCEEGKMCSSTTSLYSPFPSVASHTHECQHERNGTPNHEAKSPSALSLSSAMQPILRLGAAMNSRSNNTKKTSSRNEKKDKLTEEELQNRDNRSKAHTVHADEDKTDGDIKRQCSSSSVNKNTEHLSPMHSEEVQHVTRHSEENMLFSCEIRKSSHAASPLSTNNTQTKQDTLQLPSLSSSTSLLPQITKAVPLHSVEKVATRPRVRTPPRPPVESEFACIANLPPREEERRATHRIEHS